MTEDQRASSPQTAHDEGHYLRSRYLRSGGMWAGFAVTAAFSYFALANVDFGEVWAGLRSTNYWWLIPALIMLAATVWIRAFRWRLLFLPEHRPSLGAAVHALLVGYFFNNIMPMRTGEAVRVFSLKRRAGTSRLETAGTIVVERVSDVVALLALFFITQPWLPSVPWSRAAAVLGIAVAGATGSLVVVLSVWGERPFRRLAGPLMRLSFVPSDRLESSMANLGRGFAGFRLSQAGAVALLLGALSWAVLGLSFWFVMVGVGLQLPLLAGLLVVITIGLAMILPSSPGSLGVFEGATLIALRPYGIGSSAALSYALVLHVLNFLPYVLAGPFLMDVRSRRAALVVGGGPVPRQASETF